MHREENARVNSSIDTDDSTLRLLVEMGAEDTNNEVEGREVRRQRTQRSEKIEK